MSSQRRYTLLLAVLLIVIVGVFGATIITLQSTSHSPNPLPTLAQIADTEREAEPFVHADSTNPMMDIVSPDVESDAPVTDDEPLSTISNPIDVPAEPVTDQYILELSDDINSETLADIATGLDIDIVETIDELNRVVVLADETSINQLTAESVLSSEPDYYASALMSLPPTDPLYGVQWSLDMIGAPAAWANLPDDIPTIRVAVLDTGICEDHPDMQGTYSTFRWDYVEKDNTPQDEFGHGCGVAGVIASQNNDMGLIGVAPFVEIMPLRVLGADGVGKYSDIAHAVIDATNHGAQIINLSLGGYNKSSTLQSAVNYALTNDVYVVAATGNDGKSQPLYPAAFDGVIAVGSVNESGTVSTFSNGGEDTLAPGEMIAVPYLSNTYVYQSGTSFAAPHVSGVIALELALGSTPALDGGIIHVDVSDTPLAIPTPDVTATPEFITVNGRTIPNLGQLDEPEKTDRWSVRLSDNVDANTIASELGFRNLGPVGELKNYYVFVRDGSGTSEALALSATQALAESADILEFAQEVRRKPVLNALPSDPLVNYQWHLKNTGQSGGTPGNDINVEGAWDAGYTGENTTIAAVDDGLDITHPDFVTKYNAASSYDFNGSDTTSELDSDSNPSHEVNDIGHGTSVLGVAAADDDGSTCGVGVAYDADVASIRLVSTGHYIVDSQIADALNYAMQTNDIYNNSWGFPSFPPYPLEPLTAAAIINGIQNGRGGKGSIFVWSAGNDAEYSDHANADSFANSRYTIAVGATGHDGIRVPYSEMGTNLLVNAPSKIASIFDENLSEGGIVTSDRQGSAGSNNTSGFSNDCTDSFDGTSASAPMVSGVVALMLDANPNLTWRDVQHILVESARKNDPTDSLWNTNGAGHDFNIQYGFGTVDATAAVALAETWTNVQPEVSYSSNIIPMSQSIPDGYGNFGNNTPIGGDPVQSQIIIEENINIESVEVYFNVNHSYWGDLVFFLTSPSGTTSYIYPTHKYDNASGVFSWTVSSMEFWGEESAGDWTLTILDVWAGDTGQANEWAIKINGTPVSEFIVNTSSDVSDGTCDLSSCSLREAIIAANTYGDGAIVRIPSGTYALNIAGTGEDAAATGDLDITANIQVIGAGSDQTIINANHIDRVFDIQATSDNLDWVMIQNLTVTNGQPEINADGGGIRIQSLSELFDVNVNNNTTNGRGGGLAVLDEAVISNSNIEQNQASIGGGIYSDSKIGLHRSTLDSNIAVSNISGGGGIYALSQTEETTIGHSTISNNTAENGGGIYISSDTSGGGNPIFLMRNSTVSGNNALSDGGGIYYQNSDYGPRIDLGLVTITNNVADSNLDDIGNGGGIYLSVNSRIDLFAAILYGNQDNGGESPDCYQDPSVEFRAFDSFIGDTEDCYIQNLYPHYVNYINIDPKLGTLQDNGGATLTHALDANSPAISKVTTFSYLWSLQLLTQRDQRDVVRDESGGTYEPGAVEDNLNPNELPELVHAELNRASDQDFETQLFGQIGSWRIYRNHINLSLVYQNYSDVSTGILLYFDEPLYDSYFGQTSYSASNPDNYLIVADGANGTFDTTQCGTPVGDDILIPLGTLDAESNTVPKVRYFHSVNLVSLQLEANEITPDRYRIIACNLRDMDGNSIDNDGDGINDNVIMYDFTADNNDPYYLGAQYKQIKNAIHPFVLYPVNYSVSTLSFSSYTSTAYPISDPVHPNSITNPNNFMLIDVGANGLADTSTCGSVQGDDIEIPMSISWNGFSRATYTFDEIDMLVDGTYRFITCNLVYPNGDPFDGDYDGIPGGDYVSDFTVFAEPTNINIDMMSGSVTLSWDDLTQTETSYVIERRINVTGTPWTEISVEPADTTSYDDNDLTCNNEYVYRVQARKAGGLTRSVYSEEVLLDLNCAPMVDPDNLIATAISSTQIDLTWNDNTDNETGYQIERRESGGIFAEIATVSTDLALYSDTTAVCDKDYEYRVRAYRIFDDAFTNYTNIAIVSSPLCSPSALTVDSIIGQEHLDLSWVDNSNEETEFHILRSIADTGVFTQVSSTTAANITTFSDTGLGCYAEYFYQVTAYRSSDDQTSEPSNIAYGQTSCTDVYAPVSLTSAVNETAIDLTWLDKSPDETSFEIQRRASGTVSWTFTDTVGVNITTYTDTTTVCGGEYDYQVRAYREGDGKYSTASNIVNIRQTCPPPPAPSDLTLIALPFTNDIQLDWVDNSGTETEFRIMRSITDTGGFDEVGTTGADVITYTDTDVSLACYTPYYYKVQGYRSDDGVSSDYTATVSIWTWCDADTELPVYAPPSSVTVTPGDISQVIGFPQPSCVDYIDHAYVWEAPEIAPDYVTYTTFGSTMDTVLSFWKYDGNSYVEVGCNDDVKADGTSSLSVSFPGSSDAYFTIVGGKNGANGSITLNSGVVPTPTWTPVPTETPIPTATDLPELSTVGLYKEGLWYFRDSNQTGNADFIIRFGINTNQDWQPLVGDWNADGIDGFGLYRNGRWVLRDVIEDGSSIDYQFNFGPTEDGWQPVVGDWDGRGDDSIGLYKDGVWLLRNGLSHGDPDYQFRFNPSGQSDAIAIAGDWHDESRDRVGLYVNGRWYLSYDHQTRSGALVFNFGPSDGSWLPIVGDWDEDGDDTVGLFKDGGWRFRNSNSRGNPDFGMTFGLQGGIPIAGYRGDGEALALFASVSDLVVSQDPTATILPSMTPTLIVIPTDEPVADVTVTLTPIEMVVETATALPTDTATWTPTWTQSPTATATPTATMTPSPTATEEPLAIPENTSGT